MKKNILLFSIFAILASTSFGQKKAEPIEDIFFHLYTDSLKKGTNNYINVDGKTASGKWRPMTDKEIEFTSTVCKFQGNDLVIPENIAGKSITVKAVLKSNPNISKEVTIWIKQLPDPELPKQDFLSPTKKSKAGKK